ncbi:MAG: DinB family protein [Acidimicrobiales bacterium]
MDRTYRSSLLRRLRAVHALYGEAVSTMTVAQVNHVEREGVLPIAFSLVHQVLIEDGSLCFVGGTDPQFSDAWSAGMGLAVADHGKTRTVAEMTHQRVGDLKRLAEFQRLVFAATEAFVAGVDPATFDDVLVAPPYGKELAHTFSARVGGEAGITRSDALECWIYQHALRHLGEIEHARALVGLGGLTS